MKSKYFTLAMILLALMNVLTFVYVTQALNNTTQITNKLNNNPPKIVYVQAKDGYTPIFGKDYFNGAAGINAVSYSITRETVKDVPLLGEKGDKGDSPECLLEEKKCRGDNGIDGRSQELRLNSDTKNIESKFTDAKYWDTLIACSEYRLECP